MPRKKREVRIKYLGPVSKRVAVVLASLTVLAALGIGTSVATTVHLGVLKARVSLLEAYFAAPALDEKTVNELLTRLNSLSVGQVEDTRVQELYAKLAQLEGALPYPVANGKDLAELKNQKVVYYGVVERVSVKDKNLFLTINGTFVPVWGGAGVKVEVGDGVAVIGKVTEYQGELEIAVDSPKFVFIGR